MSTLSVPRLFQPMKVGKRMLAHRVVLAPMTRLRATQEHVHTDLAVEYYAQRASIPGTLLISEGTFIAAEAGGMPNVPGIWSDEQVSAWKRVTDAVHDKGSRIFCQLWALGRAADPDVLAQEDAHFSVVSPSDIPISGKPQPRALTAAEINDYVQKYATAAVNAVRAGFDGVEMHGANGYLIDQFLQDVSNQRTDSYGGSVENRCRFALEIVESISKVIGADKVALRLTPWGDFQDMRMKDPKPTFSYLVSRIAELYPDFGYIHVVEPLISGSLERDTQAQESNDFLRELWAPRPFINAGGYIRETALIGAERTGDLIAFGRPFLANPDLPLRLAKDLPLAEGNRETYYASALGPKGYTDYPVSDDPRANT